MTTSLLSTPPPSTRRRASQMATHAVFNSGAAPVQIEALALSYIRSVLAGDVDTLHAATNPNLPPLPRATPGRVWDGLQSDLSSVAFDSLLVSLTVPRHFRPRGSPEWWVNRMLLGGSTIAEPAQLQKDLGLDLVRHAANLRSLREAFPKGWKLLVRAELLALYQMMGTTPQHASLIRAVVHDHVILIGVVRARTLGEYLRRLATEPMGPRFDADDPLWAKRGALFTDRLVKPAKSLDQLLGVTCRGSVCDKLQQAISSGRLTWDPRLLPMARRIYQQIGGNNLNEEASATLTRAVRTVIAPLTAITPAMLRDEGLGRESFADAQLGLSVPDAVTVLAINLVALRSQVTGALAALDGGHLLPAYPAVPALVAGSAGRVCRTASALKAISDCDRHVGNTSTDPDNKAGLKLLRRVQRLLAAPAPPHSLNQLRLLPPEWSR